MNHWYQVQILSNVIIGVKSTHDTCMVLIGVKSIHDACTVFIGVKGNPQLSHKHLFVNLQRKFFIFNFFRLFSTILFLSPLTSHLHANSTGSKQQKLFIKRMCPVKV